MGLTDYEIELAQRVHEFVTEWKEAERDDSALKRAR